MNNIGKVIKKLRQEQGMVQEQVAEYLNVSTQAVSRWETGSALPDIIQVPALANLFGCSTDVLLGVDITTIKQQIEMIGNEVNALLIQKQHEEAEKLIRAKLKDYPNNYELMSWLAVILHTKKHNDADMKQVWEESIEIYEKILAGCTDDNLRSMAIQGLCTAYKETGVTGKAVELANKMPSKDISKEYLLANLLTGTEKHRNKQLLIATNIMDSLYGIIFLNDNLLDNEKAAYNLDECIALHHKVIDISKILFEKGNYGDFNKQLVDVHLHLTFFYIQKKDTAAALKHFKLAVDHAIMFDSINQSNKEEYDNLLFRGLTFMILPSINQATTMTQYLLNRSDELNNHLPAAELDLIKDELRKYIDLR